MARISLLCSTFQWFKAVFFTDPQAPVPYWRWL